MCPPAAANGATGSTEATAASAAGCSQRRIEALLTRAENALLSGTVDEGWQCLEAARRLAAAGATETELDMLGTALAAETNAKLRGWRRAAAAAHLQRAEGQAHANRAGVIAAMRLRDEHHQNEYYKLRLIERKFKLVSTYLAVTLLTMLVVSFRIPFPAEVKPDPTALRLWMVMFGVLGAAFSVALPLTTTGNNSSQIPLQLAARFTTTMRPLLGAAGALVAYLFVKSGLFSTQVQGSTYALLLVGFVAGFSERIVLKAVSTIAGDELSAQKPGEDKPATTKADAKTAVRTDAKTDAAAERARAMKALEEHLDADLSKKPAPDKRSDPTRPPDAQGGTADGQRTEPAPPKERVDGE